MTGETDAGDRHTLTDEEREQINCGCGEFADLAIGRIIGARVRAAQAQAWAEGHQVHSGCPECWDDGYGDQINPYRLGDTEQSNHKVDGRESEKHT